MAMKNLVLKHRVQSEQFCNGRVNEFLLTLIDVFSKKLESFFFFFFGLFVLGSRGHLMRRRGLYRVLYFRVLLYKLSINLEMRKM